MIDVHISEECTDRLLRELRRAGSIEIGGVLAAEHVDDLKFNVVEISIQRTGGSRANFVRSPSFHRRFIRHFLAKTGRQYDRFNYLGEWHSHPYFPAEPSTVDLDQMQKLIEERGQQANFLVLLVVKVGRHGKLEGSAHAFRRGHPPVRARLHLPHQIEEEIGTSRRSFKDLIALRSERVSKRGNYKTG